MIQITCLRLCLNCPPKTPISKTTNTSTLPPTGLILRPSDNTEANDGFLLMGDILNLEMDARMIALSACETGLGKISKGEGIIGLTRALIYAGSNNLIVSLWRVNDASTSLLMTHFYANMLKGDGYAVALRKAKLDMIKSTDYSSPYFWATFVLIGE